MESKTVDFDFVSLISIVCYSIQSDNPSKELLETCARIIYELSSSTDVQMLIDFSSNNIPKDVDLSTQAIMYKCLYIIYASFTSTTNAENFLYALSETIS